MKTSKVTLFAAVIAASMIATSVTFANPRQVKSQAALTSVDFESTKAGSLPKGWYITTKDWTGGVVEGRAAQGNHSFRFALDREPESRFGCFMTKMDASPFAGKRVSLTAKLKASSPGVKAQMWMRVDRSNGEIGSFDNMHDRPVVSSSWQDVNITFNVDSDAQGLAFGFIGHGKGAVEIDDIKLKVLN